MSILREFKAFALKGNVVELAVAVVIGGAFGAIVKAIVDDLVMPVVGALLPGGNWRTFTVTSINLQVGHLLGATVDFLLIALVLFLVVKKLLSALTAAPPPPSTKECKECLELIPLAAKRCRACTSPVV